MVISATLLHLFLLLMRCVQVFFIPGSEMLPFSVRRHLTSWVGEVLQHQKWDNLLLWLAHSLLVLVLMFFVHVNLVVPLWLGWL